MRHAFEDLVALLLRDANEYTEHLAIMLFFKLIQAVKYLLFRFIANAAGVVQQQVRFAWSIGLCVPARKQRPNNLFGIMDVHLTTERLNVKLLHYSLLSIIGGSKCESRFRDRHTPNFDALQVG